MRRETWVDICKGIAIFLVVLGHVTGYPRLIITLVYSFHIPLFFFLSGYLFKFDKCSETFIKFIKVRFSRLFIPYTAGVIITYLFGNIFNHEVLSIEQMIIGGLLGNGKNFNQFNTPLWFLPCLFITTVLFTLLHRISQNSSKIQQVTFFTVIACLGNIFMQYSGRLPWGIDVSLVALFFFFLGHTYKEFNNTMVKQNSSLSIYLITLFAIGVYYNGHVDMYARGVGNIFTFLITASCGIFITIFVAKYCNEKRAFKLLARLLAYAGQNSMAVLMLHTICFNVSYIMLKVLTQKLHINLPEPLNYLFLLFTVAGFILPLVVSYFIINRVSIIKVLFTGKIEELYLHKK